MTKLESTLKRSKVYMTTTEDGRLGRVEGILEETRTRLGNVENRFDSLESRMESRFTSLESRMDSRFTGLESRIQIQFYWLRGIMLGILIPMWVTIILAVVLRT